MAYEINWHIPRRVVLMRFSDEITLDDIREVNAHLLALIREGGLTPIHIIADLRDVKKSPGNLLEISNAIPRFKRDTVEWTVIIGGNTLMRFFSTTIARVLNLPITSARTVESAAEFILDKEAQVMITDRKTGKTISPEERSQLDENVS